LAARKSPIADMNKKGKDLNLVPRILKKEGMVACFMAPAASYLEESRNSR